MSSNFNPQLASLEQLKEWWLSDLLIQANGEELIDAIAGAFVQLESEGVAYLHRFLYDENEIRRKVALSHLASPQFVNAAILEALQAAFDSQSKALQQAALWGFIHIQYFQLERSRIEYLRRQPDERLAALAMVYLSRAYPNETVDILRTALRSSNPRDREYACDEVVDRGISELSNELIALRNDPDEYVRQAAEINP